MSSWTVHLLYPGDDLLTPLERRRGLPIGNLTSQFFANVYLDGLDHFCKEVLRAPGYLRYVDDFALFHDDPRELQRWRQRIAVWLEGRRLRLHPRKTVILPTAEPAPFLGFVLLPDGRRRLPEDNVRRFRNRLRGLRDRWREGTVTREEVRRRRGLLDRPRRTRQYPAAAPDPLSRRMVSSGAGAWLSPERVLRGGAFDNNPRNLRAANRNRNITDNRNNNVGFRVARTLQGRNRQRHGAVGRAVSVQGGS